MGPKHLFAFLLIGLYALIGAAWILWGEAALGSLLTRLTRQTGHLSYVTWAGLLASSLLVYGLIRLGEQASSRRHGNRDKEAGEQQLTKIARTIPSTLYTYRVSADDKHSFPYLSPGVEQLCGLKPEALQADASLLLPLIHPDDIAPILESIRVSASTMRAWREEFRIGADQDGERWIEGYSVPEAQTDGSVIWYGSLRDITERKQAEQALSESEARVNLILETVPHAMLVVDGEGGILRANIAAHRSFGYEHGELLGRPVDALVPAHRRGAHRARRETYLKTPHTGAMGKGLALSAQRKDGSEFPVEVTLGPVQVDAKVQVIVTVLDVSERRAAELQLERFAQIVETSGDMLALVDLEGRHQLANSAYARFHGLTPAALRGLSKKNLWSEEAYRQLEPALTAALRGEEQRVTITVPHGGEQCSLEAEYRPFRNRDEVLGVVISIRDVTARVLSICALAESEQTLERAQSLAKVGSWTYDVATRMFRRSAEASRLLGLEQTDVPRSIVSRTWHPEDKVRIEDAFRAAHESGIYEIEHRIIVAGKVKWLHARAEFVFDRDGRTIKAYGVTQDISEMREAQLQLKAHQEHLEKLVASRTDELRQQTRYLRTLIDTFPFMVWLKDTDSRFVAVNRAAADNLGAELRTIPGKTDHDFIAPEAARAFVEQDRDVMEGRAPITYEEFFDGAKGGFWIETYKAPVTDEDGTVLGTVGFARDITERRAIEQARDQALAETTRLARARSEFLANMSHEIRTPLNAVLGLAQLGMRTAAGDRARNTFAHIVDAGQLLLGILNDILDYAKIEAGKLQVERERFELGQVTDRAINVASIIAYPKGLRFLVQEAHDLPHSCVGDALRLSQVLMNLLSNAVKFTNTGALSLAVRREAAALVFEVKDTGIGISELQLERLFQPFEQADSSTTRRFGGTGLGLAITKHLVDAMGGSIEAWSRLDDGSRFQVRLPLLQPEYAATPQALRFVFAGLPAAECTGIAQELSQRDAFVRSLEPRAAPGEPCDLLVVDSSALDEALVDALLAAAANGQRLALVCTPQTTHPMQHRLEASAAIVLRPLRARHLIIAATAGREQSTTVAGSLRLAGVRILAAEDNELNRMVLEQMLAQEGATLVCVENGRLAVDRIQVDGATAYDVVLTDIQMPVMDGYECARAIHGLAPALPIIGLSAHAMVGERARCLAVGMSDHIAKPVDVDTLVASVLGLAGAAGSPRSATMTQTEEAPVPSGRNSRMIDWIQLEKRYRGKRSFIDKLIATALRSYAQMPEQLCGAVQAHDLDRIAFLAHTIKGTSANLSARAVSELAARTEHAARTRQESVGALATVLAQHARALLDELRDGPSPTHEGRMA